MVDILLMGDGGHHFAYIPPHSSHLRTASAFTSVEVVPGCDGAPFRTAQKDVCGGGHNLPNLRESTWESTAAWAA